MTALKNVYARLLARYSGNADKLAALREQIETAGSAGLLTDGERAELIAATEET